MKPNLNVASVTKRLTITTVVCIATACNAWGDTAPVAKANTARAAVPAKPSSSPVAGSGSSTKALAAAEPQGSGLQGLADRVSAPRGTLRVSENQPHGTLVVAELPCAW